MPLTPLQPSRRPPSALRPPGATATGLKAYATSVANDVYAIVLAVPVSSVGLILDSELQLLGVPPPVIASPAPPPAGVVQAIVTIPAGVYLAIIIPTVCVLVGLGVLAYWLKKRRDKRVPMATVQPQGGAQGASVGGQLLVSGHAAREAQVCGGFPQRGAVEDAVDIKKD